MRFHFRVLMIFVIGLLVMLEVVATVLLFLQSVLLHCPITCIYTLYLHVFIFIYIYMNLCSCINLYIGKYMQIYIIHTCIYVFMTDLFQKLASNSLSV